MDALGTAGLTKQDLPKSVLLVKCTTLFMRTETDLSMAYLHWFTLDILNTFGIVYFTDLIAYFLS